VQRLRGLLEALEERLRDVGAQAGEAQEALAAAEEGRVKLMREIGGAGRG
jgi:hypothetical protein